MSGKIKDGGNKLLKKRGYDYGFTRKEKLLYIVLGTGQLALLGYIFYKSIIVMCLLQFLLPFYLKIKERECRTRHINTLKAEFKEMLEVYQGFILAGYAVDNALLHTRKELAVLGYEKSMVVRELDFMARQLKLHVPLGELFMEWGRRSRLKDIENFASIFMLSCQTGGNISKIMRVCSGIIGDKIDVERDIDTLLASKKYEQKVINLIPLFILLYVDFSSKGFLDPLYMGIFGRWIMTLCLAVYFLAFFISQKIMRIEV